MIKNKRCLTIIEFILNIPYHILFFYVKRKTMNLCQKKYYFSVCCIFKNEAQYLAEWIEYNRILGVDHIYMYNNNSTDNYYQILNRYIKEGFVSVLEWPKNYAQMEAYEDCYNRYRNDTNWLAFWDIDEFICPLYETNIKDFMKKYEGYPALIVYWMLFGTNGLLKPDANKLVTEQFTCSHEHLDGTGKIILSTNNYYSPTHMYHHHIFCRYRLLGLILKIPMITEHYKFVFFPQIYRAPKINTIQLNHYWSKSYEEFSDKIAKGDVARKENEEIRKKIQFFYNHEQGNKVENKTIFRFMIKLKLALNKK